VPDQLSAADAGPMLLGLLCGGRRELVGVRLRVRVQVFLVLQWPTDEQTGLLELIAELDDACERGRDLEQIRRSKRTCKAASREMPSEETSQFTASTPTRMNERTLGKAYHRRCCRVS
jgi:hypothetical protein